MRSSSDLFKKGIMTAYTSQPNVKLNSDTIGDALKYSMNMEGETKESEYEDAKNKFKEDLKLDSDFVEFKKKSRKHDKDTGDQYSYGVPNAASNDPFVKKKKYGRVNKIEADEATGASSAGSFSAPLFTKEETNETEKIPGGLAKGKTLKDIAKIHSKGKIKGDIEEVFKTLKKELVKGVKTELEHTDSIKIAMEIAKDHLYEDPHYYTKLSKIESKEGDIEKVEATEATTSASVGAYSTPAFIAKNKKNWRGGKKPIYKGGKFVKVKKKCLTFPYCNQGAGAVKIFENGSVKEAINSASQKLGVDEQIIKKILYYNLKSKNKK